VSLAITNATVVLPDRVMEGWAVGIQDGVICHIGPTREVTGLYADEVDAGDAYLMPGIIDLHNDSLETEINPRPETNLPVEFALANLERRLIASGVTTEFHAMAFMNMAKSSRTIDATARRAEYIAAIRRQESRVVDHHILHRLDVWSPESLDAIFQSTARLDVRYVSLNDHTPGQGQYRDLAGYMERMTAWRQQRGGAPLSPEEVYERIAARAADTETLPFVYRRVIEERGEQGIIIASHDDDSPQKVEMQFASGSTICEFPITVDTARRARELGMWIVVGAPNIVRGGSSSGNQDARELFELGLADIICADYHAPSLLVSAFKLISDGLCDLPFAVRTLTLNAAKAVGLERVGAIRMGYRADLTIVRETTRGHPAVEAAFRAGSEVFRLRQPAREAVGV
jgi:alpha-D-ribose 1-methylphosphonate 5-triphosphate diphosphatase